MPIDLVKMFDDAVRDALVATLQRCDALTDAERWEMLNEFYEHLAQQLPLPRPT